MRWSLCSVQSAQVATSSGRSLPHSPARAVSRLGCRSVSISNFSRPLMPAPMHPRGVPQLNRSTTQNRNEIKALAVNVKKLAGEQGRPTVEAVAHGRVAGCRNYADMRCQRSGRRQGDPLGTWLDARTVRHPLRDRTDSIAELGTGPLSAGQGHIGLLPRHRRKPRAVAAGQEEVV